MPIEPMYPTAEVAKALNCSPTHVRNLIRTGRLTATNIGIGRPRWRIAESAVTAYNKAKDESAPGRPALTLVRTVA